MDTTILNDSGFQTLPKGVRRMLVASEAYFFEETASRHKEQRENGCDAVAMRDLSAGGVAGKMISPRNFYRPAYASECSKCCRQLSAYFAARGAS